MPTSELSNLSPIMRAICAINPKSVLDLGIGCGKYGALCREYLDFSFGRIKREDWQAKICGIEAWPNYQNPLWDCYTEVGVGDFMDPYHYSGYKGWDLVLMIDSLEHVDKEQGTKFLEMLLESNHYVLISCPWGVNYLEQGAVVGNEYERHRAHWKPSDFIAMGGQLIHMGICVVGLFVNQNWGK